MMDIFDSHIVARHGLICTPDTNHSEILYIVIKRTFSEQLSERGFGQRKSGSDRFYTGLRPVPSTFTGG
jgi:hypothetical protein